MGFGYREYHLELWDELRQPENRLTNITQIEIRNSSAGALLVSGTNLFADQEGQSGFTNPVTTIASDGHLKFFSSIDPIDVVVYMDDGRYVVYSNLSATDPKKHAIMQKSGAQLVYKIPFGVSDDTAIDTGIDLPAGFVVTDAFIEVITVDASADIDVGLLAGESGGDEDGFIVAASVAALGFIQNEPLATLGSNIDYLADSTYGDFLNTFIQGTDVVAVSGAYARKNHVCDGVAKSVTYTGSSGMDSGVGYIYLVGYLLPYSPNKALGVD